MFFRLVFKEPDLKSFRHLVLVLDLGSTPHKVGFHKWTPGMTPLMFQIRLSS